MQDGLEYDVRISKGYDDVFIPCQGHACPITGGGKIEYNRVSLI
jgi:hypothetical protein